MKTGGPLQEIATARDKDYFLRGLDHTVCRFRAAPRSYKTSSPLENEVLSFIRQHPGATISDIQQSSSSLKALDHVQARSLLVSLVDAGALQVVGHVPLEQVDRRYERIRACDVCGTPSRRHPVVFWKYNTPVVRCTSCGLLYSNPRWKTEHLFGRYTTDFWQQYADKISRTAPDETTNLDRWYPYLSTLGPVRQMGRLLDVGCATGEFLVAAKAQGWEVYGVETSPIAAGRAEQAAGASIHVGTLESAPYEDSWFDAVTLWDVIEHVQSPMSYMQQAARLVRPGGLVALTTPNIRSAAFKLLGPKWWVVGPNDHIYYFAPRTMQRLLTRCGLKIYVMHTDGGTIETWRKWLRYPPAHRLAPLLQAIIKPLARRFLWGDELYVVARREQ
ncbi:MAG TPA: class I SAM-dependent methyltransferase [Chloroflexia bacterium]|nr:class I SAM-dependent methyltransferase [Chloroflexia bacterium]